MTAMGALNLKVDVKTRDRFRQLHGEANNPDSHRRRTISLALDGDQQENIVQGLLNARSARGRGRRGVRLERIGQDVLPNGRLLCRACSKDYANQNSYRR